MTNSQPRHVRGGKWEKAELWERERERSPGDLFARHDGSTHSAEGSWNKVKNAKFLDFKGKYAEGCGGEGSQGLTASDDRLNGDPSWFDFFGKLADRCVRVLIGVRINVGADEVGREHDCKARALEFRGGGRKKVVKMEISKINAKPGKMGDGFVYQATLIFSLTFKGISFALR